MLHGTTTMMSLLGRLSLGGTKPAAAGTAMRATTMAIASPSSALRQFHTTPLQSAKAASGGQKQKGSQRKKKSKKPQVDPRIINLKLSMPRRVPAPLRFGRNRALRHWTIHRAWQLHLRQRREQRERDLARLQQSMSGACEELRKTSGPGTRDEGYLYRVAMEKKGVFGYGGVPIEYARYQTETPAKGEAWNHGWKRTSSK